MIIAYEYTSACGAAIKKVVICDTVDEYKRIKKRIESCGYKVIEFEEVLNSKNIL